MLYTLIMIWLQVDPGMTQLIPAHWGEHVRALSSAASNDARFDALTTMLRDHGVRFTVEPFTIDRPRGNEPRTNGRNVVVTIGNGSEDLLIGAHYDAVRLPDGSLSHGAVDNAASCEILVELAYRISQTYERSRPIRIKIVWFDMEEIGLLGSAAYVRTHQADRMRAMINLDVNAYGDTILYAPPPEGSAGRAPEDTRLRLAIEGACAREDIDCMRFEQLPTGDDRTFGAAGIPTLSIATLPALEAHQLWLALRPGARLGPENTPAVMQTIHTRQDVPAKVDGAALIRTSRLIDALFDALAVR